MTQSRESRIEEIDPLLFERLGRICAYWAVVESHLGALFSHMTEANHLSMFVVVQSASGRKLIEWLRLLLGLYVGDDKIGDTLRDILNTADEIRIERNALIHGIWDPADDPKVAIVNSIRIGRTELIKDELITPSDLQDLMDRMRELSVKLSGIGVRLGYYNPA